MKARGFTLLEMIVAIGIFALIAAIIYPGFDRFVAARDQLAERGERLKQLQIAMTILEQDLRFATNRSVRDGFGDPENAMISSSIAELGPGEVLRLTTFSPDPRLPNVQRLRRVAWRLNQGVLSRTSWTVLDRDQDSLELARELLDRVSDFSLQFYVFDDQESLQTQDEWDSASLPQGIELLLSLDNGRQYRRVFHLAGGSG